MAAYHLERDDYIYTYIYIQILNPQKNVISIFFSYLVREENYMLRFKMDPAWILLRIKKETTLIKIASYKKGK